MIRRLAALSLAALLGCTEHAELSAPPPAEVTREAVGHFCGMTVADHPGPKGQAHVAGREGPLWFSSVRDTIAFLLLPEETDTVRAVYVNDMAGATDWAAPPPGSWILADQAVYVIGSAKRGGMGALEVVPFSSRQAADAFVREHGGCAVGFEQIPRDYVLGDAEGAARDWCAGLDGG